MTAAVKVVKGCVKVGVNVPEVVWRVQGIGDYCAGCGDPLEPGELAVWGRDGVTHEFCTDDREDA